MLCDAMHLMPTRSCRFPFSCLRASVEEERRSSHIVQMRKDHNLHVLCIPAIYFRLKYSNHLPVPAKPWNRHDACGSKAGRAGATAFHKLEITMYHSGRQKPTATQRIWTSGGNKCQLSFFNIL